MSLQQIEKDLETVDVILPKRHHYLTETAETHYIHNHHREGLSLATEAVKELYPSYAEAWEAALMSRSSHLFNIFICRKPVLDGYCKWLFDILSYVENRLDITGYSDSEKRVYGYLGELLLDAYVNHRGLSCGNIRFSIWKSRISSLITKPVFWESLDFPIRTGRFGGLCIWIN